MAAKSGRVFCRSGSISRSTTSSGSQSATIVSRSPLMRTASLHHVDEDLRPQVGEAPRDRGSGVDDRRHADGTMQRLRRQGVDAAILDRADYSSLGTEYAVYSGRYETQAEAEAHKVELAQLGISKSYLKHVTR